jgi:hypothetical protein
MENRNSTLSEELRDVLKSQQNVDGVIRTVNPIIQPVIDVNPKHARLTNIVRNGIRTTTGAGSPFTTPADRDFYLTGINYSYVGNATSDGTVGRVIVFVEGVARDIINLGHLTLTAFSQNGYLSFNNPIKLDKNSNISITLSFTVGAESMNINLFGFTVDNPKA